MFLVECPTARKFMEARFELYIAFEELIFGTHANCLSEGFSCHREARLPNFKVCFEEPDLGEGELLMRD